MTYLYGSRTHAILGGGSGPGMSGGTCPPRRFVLLFAARYSGQVT
jgi:hypothetical protein